MTDASIRSLERAYSSDPTTENLAKLMRAKQKAGFPLDPGLLQQAIRDDILPTYESNAKLSSYVKAVWSPKEQILATVGWQGILNFWNSRGEKSEVQMDFKGPINDIAWSPDGREIVTAVFNGPVEILDVLTRQSTSILHQLLGGGLVAWSPSGQIIAIAGDERIPETGGVIPTIYFWNQSTQRLNKIVSPHRFGGTGTNGPIDCLGWSPAGDVLATGGRNRATCLWKQVNGEMEVFATLQQGGMGAVISCNWSPDGQTLATISSEGTKIWNHLGRELAFFQNITDWDWSPDGQIVAAIFRGGSSACNRNTIRFVNAQTLDLQTSPADQFIVSVITTIADLQCEPHPRMQTQFAWSSDSQVLATYINAKIRFWHMYP